MNKQSTLLLPAIMLMLAAAFTRLIPHAPNFTAIGAIAIFGGSVVKDKKLAFLLPLSALLLSDLFFQLFTTTKGFYGVSQLFVYAAFMIITALATLIKNRSAVNIALAAVWSGIIFFVISNMGVWLSSTIYPKTLAGFASCLAIALPFYSNDILGNFALNTILGTGFYAAIMFAAYSLIEKQSFKHAVA